MRKEVEGARNAPLGRSKVAAELTAQQGETSAKLGVYTGVLCFECGLYLRPPAPQGAWVSRCSPPLAMGKLASR